MSRKNWRSTPTTITGDTHGTKSDSVGSANVWSRVWEYTLPLGIKYNFRANIVTDLHYVKLQTSAPAYINVGTVRIGKSNVDDTDTVIIHTSSAASWGTNFPISDYDYAKWSKAFKIAPGQKFFVEYKGASTVSAANSTFEFRGIGLSKRM
jgi:hypothetical protein